MLKQKVIPPQSDVFPEFVIGTMERTRILADQDKVIRLRIDHSAKTAVSFTAKWQGDAIRDIERRVFLQTKSTEDGKYLLVLMNKIFDEDAVTVEYTDKTLLQIPTDILRFLRMGNINR
jgi:hypothetical protein